MYQNCLPSNYLSKGLNSLVLFTLYLLTQGYVQVRYLPDKDCVMCQLYQGLWHFTCGFLSVGSLVFCFSAYTLFTLPITTFLISLVSHFVQMVQCLPISDSSLIREWEIKRLGGKDKNVSMDISPNLFISNSLIKELSEIGRH